MTTQLNFSVREDTDDETDKPIQYGTFSRDWAEEDELDELIDSLESGRISHKQALLVADAACFQAVDQLVKLLFFGPISGKRAVLSWLVSLGIKLFAY